MGRTRRSNTSAREFAIRGRALVPAATGNSQYTGNAYVYTLYALVQALPRWRDRRGARQVVTFAGCEN